MLLRRSSRPRRNTGQTAQQSPMGTQAARRAPKISGKMERWKIYNYFTCVSKCLSLVKVKSNTLYVYYIISTYF